MLIRLVVITSIVQTYKLRRGIGEVASARFSDRVMYLNCPALMVTNRFSGSGSGLMKILFLHGWNSRPGGVKPQFLASNGLDVINPALDDDNFEAALAMAQEAYDRNQPDVVVGSSRGGAVALNIQTDETPLVLICPAWKNWGGSVCLKRNSVILHSRHDDVIPFEHSEELVAMSGLPAETLIETGRDHRLADEDSLAVLMWACRLLGSGVPLPWLDDDTEHAGPTARSGSADSQEEVTYLCDACGEEIVIPLDLAEGAVQSYVEDCPVCCRASVIHVQIDDEGNVSVHAEPEQDRD